MKTTEEILNAIKHLPPAERERLRHRLAKEWLLDKESPEASKDMAPDGRDWLEWAAGLHKELWRDAQGKPLDAQEYVDQERAYWD